MEKATMNRFNIKMILLGSVIFLLSNISIAQAPPCGSVPPGGNTACLATPITDTVLCGNVDTTVYTANSWSQLNTVFYDSVKLTVLFFTFHSTIENNSFYSFIADSCCMAFDLYLDSCTSQEHGLQWMIFSSDSCDTGTVHYYSGAYNWIMNNQPPPVEFDSTVVCGLTPGHKYYFMFDGEKDGAAKNSCGFTVDFLYGVQFDTSVVYNYGISLNVPLDTTICGGNSITTTASGGTTYTWSGDSGLSSTSGATVTITPPSAPGIYHYQVSSIVGCATYNKEITIHVQSIGVTPQFNAIGPICKGENFTLPTTSINGIVGTWSPAINDSITTSYTFTPTNSTCANDTTLTIIVNDSITPQFTNPGPICSGVPYTLPTTSNNGISGTWTPAINDTVTTTYIFMPNSGECAIDTTLIVVVDSAITPIFTNLGPYCFGTPFTLQNTSNNNILGTWSPNINNTSTTIYTFTPDSSNGPGGCAINSTTMTVVIFPLLVVTINGNALIQVGENDLLTAAGADTYIWSTGSTADTTNVSPPQTTTYLVTGTDSNGCRASDTFTVSVTTDQHFAIGVPTAFSPNGDGINDILYVRGGGVKSLQFLIYNRYGQKVFESDDMNTGWDGTMQGKKLNPGVFVYYVKAVFTDNSIKKIKGNVTMVK